MMAPKFLFLLFTTNLALGAFTFAMPAQVLIIRHAEKPNPEGRELSEKGFRRARALVNYFKSHPEVTQFGTPVAIYAMKPKDEEGSIRAIQTVTPLANALGLQVLSPLKKDALKELVSKIKSTHEYDGKMVLICWEHKVIPDMAVEFGVQPRPENWPKEDFSTVYEIDFKGDRVSNFKSYPEKVNP